MEAIEILDKKYILDNYKNLQFECKDNVQLVRDYLENECGFGKSSWKTYDIPNLIQLNINGGYVHGNRSYNNRTLVDIYELIENTNNINVEFTEKGWNYGN